MNVRRDFDWSFIGSAVAQQHNKLDRPLPGKYSLHNSRNIATQLFTYNKVLPIRNRVHTGSGAHSASYPMGTERSYPGGKAIGM